MNIREYIESGILEAYALGALSPIERTQVEAHIAQYPELGDELKVLEATMQRFATNLAKQPPPDLEEKIWPALSSSAPVSADSKVTQDQPRLIPFHPEYRRSVDWKYAAIWAGLIVSLCGNLIMWNRAKMGTSARLTLNTELTRLKNEQSELAELAAEYIKARDMMADTGMQTIVMHTMLPGHPMAATVYWSKTSGTTYVAMNALPEPPKGMQYQLWAIKDGKPVSMGVLPNSMANSPAMQKVPGQMTGSEAFAISLEKEGGNATPTTVYVLGKA